jgi:uncharacterized protein YjbJ (UPF0337 family)
MAVSGADGGLEDADPKHEKNTQDQIKGTVKEQAGKITNNPDLTAEGRDEKLSGKIRKKIGRIGKVFEK